MELFCQVYREPDGLIRWLSEDNDLNNDNFGLAQELVNGQDNQKKWEILTNAAANKGLSPSVPQDLTIEVRDFQPLIPSGEIEGDEVFILKPDRIILRWISREFFPGAEFLLLPEEDGSVIPR